MAELKEAGLWSYAHPWLNLLLPGHGAAGLAGTFLDALTPDDLGPGGVVLLYPLLRARLRIPLTANRSAYDAVRAAGGTQYSVGSVPFGRTDWRRHFGPAWPRFADARRIFDPHGALVPGQGIF